MKRVSEAELGRIEMTLVRRDRQILQTLRQLRYLKTGQIQRLYFDRKITWRARITTTMEDSGRRSA